MRIFSGRVEKIRPNGAWVFVPDVVVEQGESVYIGVQDQRLITQAQRKKIFLLLDDIGLFTGDTKPETKANMKEIFRGTRNDLDRELPFSLANCQVEDANEFITFLIDFCLQHDIPTRHKLYELAYDLEGYTYSCLMNKKCVVCGINKVDLHHVDKIGAGNDRKELYQIGMRVVSLCRKHHTEIHSRGEDWLTKELYIQPIPLTVEIGRRYGLTRKNLYGE